MNARHQHLISGLLLLLCIHALPAAAAQENGMPTASDISQPRALQHDLWPERWLQSSEWQDGAWLKWVGLASFTGFIGLLRYMRSRRRSQQGESLATAHNDLQPAGLPDTGPDVLRREGAELVAESAARGPAQSSPPVLSDKGVTGFDDNLESVQKAQFWLALQKPEEAIAILAPLCATNRCPRGWFLLLELYVMTGRRAEYEAAIPRFRARFNAKVPDWNEAATGKRQRNLVDAPELMERIDRALNGSGNVKAWLRSLLIDTRNGTRQGFDWGIYQDLLLLFEVVCEGWSIQRCEQLQQIKRGRFLVEG